MEMPEDQVFLSYAHEDLETVRKVYEGLTKRGVKVWFDKEHLKSGRWKFQITKAIARSRYFFICLSRAALKKTGEDPGFQDEELNAAYNIAQQQDERIFTIVPVRLEDCDRGDSRLSIFQQYDLFPINQFESALDKLAIHHGGHSLVNATIKDTRTGDKRFEDEFLGKANAYLYARDYERAINLIERRRKPPPVIGERWFKSKAELYALTTNIARAAARGVSPPFDEALKDTLSKLKTITLVPGTFQRLGEEVVFSVYTPNINDQPVQIWVRAGKVDKSVAAETLESTLLEALRDIKSGRSPKPTLPPSGADSNPIRISPDTIGKFSTKRTEILKKKLKK